MFIRVSNYKITDFVDLIGEKSYIVKGSVIDGILFRLDKGVFFTRKRSLLGRRSEECLVGVSGVP